MKKRLTDQQKAELQAKIVTAEQNINALLAKDTRSAEDNDLLAAARHDQEISQLRLDADEALAARQQADSIIADQRTTKASAAVRDAVHRGVIGSKETEVQAKWQALCIESDTNIALLASMKGRVDTGTRYLVQPVQITRESNSNMLHGLAELCAKNAGEVRGSKDFTLRAKLEHARAFARVYAKEILPRLKEGDDIPLEGIQNLGAVASTIISTRTLELLTMDFPIIKSIYTDLSDQIVSYGDTLTTRIVGIPSVVSYNTSTGWASSDQTDTDVSITYNRQRGVQFQVDAQTIASSVRRLFSETAPAQAYALGKDVVDFLYTKITLAAFVTGVTDLNGNARVLLQAGLATFGRSNLVDMAKALDLAGNPEMNRSIVLNADYYAALEKDPSVIQLATYQAAQTGIFTGGTLPRMSGLQPIKAVNLAGTISGQNLVGFAFTPSAIVLASRLSADYVNVIPGAGNGISTVITTPAGLSANQVQFVDNVKALTYQRLEMIYGANAGQPNAGQILTDV